MFPGLENFPKFLVEQKTRRFKLDLNSLSKDFEQKITKPTYSCEHVGINH